MGKHRETAKRVIDALTKVEYIQMTRWSGTLRSDAVWDMTDIVECEIEKAAERQTAEERADKIVREWGNYDGPLLEGMRAFVLAEIRAAEEAAREQGP